MLRKTVIILLIALAPLTFNLHGQLLKNSLFRIYRAEFIQGTSTQFRLNSDSTYNIKVTEIHCSLCDSKQLSEIINSEGKWFQRNDTVIIEHEKKFLLLGATLIRPLFVIGLELDSLSSEKAILYKERIIEENLQDFHLVYDTYPDGIAKLIKDKHRLRRDEYEIEFKQNGTINSVKYFWDDKRKKRLR